MHENDQILAQEGEERDLSISDTLSDLVSTQIEELQSRQLQTDLFATRKSIFAWFKASEIFKQITFVLPAA